MNKTETKEKVISRTIVALDKDERKMVEKLKKTIGLPSMSISDVVRYAIRELYGKE